jgi:NMD protein affecting ribosome stability and mRNA decay
MKPFTEEVNTISERDGKTLSWIRVHGTGFTAQKSNQFKEEKKTNVQAISCSRCGKISAHEDQGHR